MKLKKKRRQKGKTDYLARLKLLKSGKKRIVIRKSNKYINIQAVESYEAKDKVLFTINSKKLIEYGWPEKLKGSLKSLSAAYLTGLLFSKKLNSKEEFIIDTGLYRTIKGNRIYAVLKGLVDGGLKTKTSEKIFPSEERIKGKHMKNDFENNFNKIKQNIEK